MPVGSRYSRTLATEMDAEAWLAAAERCLFDGSLRPNTVSAYRQLLDSRILPTFRDTPLVEATLADIKLWRA